MDKKLEIVKQTLGPLRIKENEPMSLHTGNRVGGNADLYFEATSVSELVKAINIVWELKIPSIVLGGGTNVLVSDRGIDGLVIKNRSNQINILGFKGKINQGTKKLSNVFVEADAGVLISHLVRYTIEESLGGLESFLGLPGTVGGAIYNNAHFQRHGGYISNVLTKATLLTEDGKIQEVDNSYFKFAYDYSILQETKELILRAVFKLRPDNKQDLWAKAEEASKTIRLAEQPYDFPSCGCTWQNISREDAMRVGTPKLTLSAGYLIDQVGLKGQRLGDAQISPKHANFIVNLGNAKASDWLGLMALTKAKVFERFGVKLKPEIFLTGRFTQEERGQVFN